MFFSLYKASILLGQVALNTEQITIKQLEKVTGGSYAGKRNQLTPNFLNISNKSSYNASLKVFYTVHKLQLTP